MRRAGDGDASRRVSVRAGSMPQSKNAILATLAQKKT